MAKERGAGSREKQLASYIVYIPQHCLCVGAGNNEVLALWVSQSKVCAIILAPVDSFSVLMVRKRAERSMEALSH